MPQILIETPVAHFEAALVDSPPATALLENLPLTASANTWGDEIYFSTPVTAELETNASDQLPAGSIAFWPPGNAFCIIWGPTPASHADEPRFASPVNHLGQITGSLTDLSKLQDGDSITLRLP